MIYAFAIALLLFMGCPFGLAGHYRLYYKKESSDKEKTSDKQQYATRQEKDSTWNYRWFDGYLYYICNDKRWNIHILYIYE